MSVILIGKLRLEASGLLLPVVATLVAYQAARTTEAVTTDSGIHL